MAVTTARYIRLLHQLAPTHLAESWDNVGLQVGNPDRPTKKIGVALDPLPEIVHEACAKHMDLLVTHHPLFFKPIKRILGNTPQGRMIEKAITHQLAIYCAHTNLDSVPGGVNDVLSNRLGLNRLRVLQGAGDAGLCKLSVFVPLDSLDSFFERIVSLGVGRIGPYSCCTFRSEGIGTFLPDDEASPAIGEIGTLNEVREYRIEMLVPQKDVRSVVANLKEAHPYETMAYDVYPITVGETEAGLGRVGKLASSMPLSAFCAQLKKTLNLETVKVVGTVNSIVDTVAVCSGSGGSLFSAAAASGAQVYVSGDLGYHTARDAQMAGIALIDIGHFASEHLVVDVLVNKLKNAIAEAGLTADVEAMGSESDPFLYL